jgi:hypothetical protein
MNMFKLIWYSIFIEASQNPEHNQMELLNIYRMKIIWLNCSKAGKLGHNIDICVRDERQRLLQYFMARISLCNKRRTEINDLEGHCTKLRDMSQQFKAF